MRNTKVVAFPVVGLLALMGMTARTGGAQGTNPETVTITAERNRLVLTVGGKTTSLTADRIVRFGKENKGYRLQGNFRVVGPDGQAYEGKEAEATLTEGDPGDGSRSQMLQLVTQNALRTVNTSPATQGKPSLVGISLNNDGERLTMTLYLNPKTLYANKPRA